METVQVYIRFRAYEKGDLAPWKMTPTTIALEGYPHTYAFDCIFPPEASQMDVFSTAAKPLLNSLYFPLSLDGYNATIFAYGQSVTLTQGSGKTFTMLGPEEVTSGLVNDCTIYAPELQEKAGIIPLSIFHLFEQVSSVLKESIEFSIKCSYLEIYNESINDLLSDPPAHNLKIREFPRLGMCVIGSTEKSVTCPDDVFACLALGTMNRITGATEMNQRSSRSHTLFVITVEQKFLTGSTKLSKLNLVDLAGSEKVSKTGASGQALKEAQNINLSLTTLGRCIKALSGSKEEHIPFRESKLTLILKEALGGNAKTSLICAISQKVFHVEEGKGTLKFAERAKKVQTKARSNVKKSPEELLAIIEQLKAEIAGLKRQTKSKDVEEDATVRYAELKAQYDSMVESTQFEIEHLRARVEQLAEPSMRFPLQLQEHLDRIEELNYHLSTVLAEKEAIRKSHEEEVCAICCKAEATSRELEIEKKKMEGALGLLAKSKEELFEKEQECEKLAQKVAMCELFAKSDAEKAASLRESIAALSSEIEEIKKERTDLQKSVTSFIEKEALMQGELIKTQNALQQVARESEQRLAQVATATQKTTELDVTVKSLSARLEEKDAKINELMETYQQSALAYQKQIIDLTEENRRNSANRESASRSHHAKLMLNRLVKEMEDLQLMYRETELRFRQELVKTREDAEEKVHCLEETVAALQASLEAERKQKAGHIQNWKLALVEQDSLRFHLTKVKAELAQLGVELNKEKVARVKAVSQLTEANSQLEAFKKLQSSGDFVIDSELAAEKQSLRSAERKYRVSLDDIQARILHFTAENSTLSEALSAKEAELRTQRTQIRDLESELAILRLQTQKDEQKLKIIRLVTLMQRNRSSVAQMSRGRFVSHVTQEIRLMHLSLSSQSLSQSSEEEKSLHFAERTWRLPHRDLYGIPDVQTLYSNEVESESDCSVQCKHFGADDNSGEESEEAEDVLE